MSERTLLVSVDIGGKPHLAGRLVSAFQGGREDAAFEPDALEEALR